jgi:hypothetical protein
MADDLQIKKCWFHKNHYDIPKRRIREITQKCTVISSRTIIRIIKNNSVMNKEKTIPFQWEGWDQHDTLSMSFYNVEFLEDFGAFRKGEKFSSVSVDYGEGIIEGYDESGANVIAQQKFTAIPTE